MVNITLIFAGGITTIPSDDEITTSELYPVDIDAAEVEAGYMGALPYCRGVGRELGNNQVRVKVRTPDGQVLYSTRDRNTWHPIGTSNATP